MSDSAQKKELCFGFDFQGEEQLTLFEKKLSIEYIMTNDRDIHHNIAKTDNDNLVELIKELPFAEFKRPRNGDIIKVKMIQIDIQKGEETDKIVFIFEVSKN